MKHKDDFVCFVEKMNFELMYVANTFFFANTIGIFVL